jgi:hypothetical protein
MNETPKTVSDADAAAGTKMSPHKKAMAAKAAAKQARLKAALRDNLRRRKATNQQPEANEV